MNAFVFIVLACVATVFSSDVESRAKLLGSKSISNHYFVENKEITVVYKLFNVGSSAALNVVLADESFPIKDFETVRGLQAVEWKSIAPGSNVTHVSILRPLKDGAYNFTAAQIFYDATPDAVERQVGFTSGPGEAMIMSEVDYNRKYSPHLLEWSAFAVMCMPSLAIPFALWYSSHSKYSQARPKKA